MNEIDWSAYGVDVDDAGFWDRYNSAVESAQHAESRTGTEAENIRAYCGTFRAFYAALIGEERTMELLDNVKENRREYDAVFASLLRCIHDQKAEANRRMANILSQYAPKVREENGNAASAV